MRKLVVSLGTTALLLGLGAPAFATSPDIYVVNFRKDASVESQKLDNSLTSALPLVGDDVEHVVIDTSNAAKWEKGAHEAFDRDIVPIFNKWVGLPGFAAVVDAKTKRVIGCVNGQYDAIEMAEEIRKMKTRASGLSKASIRSKTTNCPPAFNQVPG